MPYRLSDPAWIAFQNQINVQSLNLPPWGGVVQWGNQFILVYICQADGTLCKKGEVMLTDVSDRADLIQNVPHEYNPYASVWVYQLPAAAMTNLLSEAKDVMESAGQVIQQVATNVVDPLAAAVGSAAGKIVAPVAGAFTIPLIAVGLVLAWLYLPHPKS